MGNPNNPSEGFTNNPHLNSMFEAQDEWAQLLNGLNGMVEQARRSGFTKSQAHAMVATALVAKVAESAFVTDPKEGA